MSDFDFADSDNAPLWLRVEEQVGDTLEDLYGQGIIDACARIALAVYRLVNKSTALPPAEKEALSKSLWTDMIQPLKEFVEFVEIVNAPLAVPTSLVEKSEAEVEKEGWISLNETLSVAQDDVEFVREELEAAALALERLVEL
jgi:hypothetical protein